MTQSELGRLGIKVVVRNSGQHHIFVGATGEDDPSDSAEWWPSTGRLVFNRRYKNPKFAWDQARAYADVAAWFVARWSRRQNARRPAYEERLDQIV